MIKIRLSGVHCDYARMRLEYLRAVALQVYKYSN